MNWIESLLHIAPDHGDGALEAILLLVLLAPLLWRRARARTLVK